MCPAAVIDEHVIDVPVIDESIVNPPAAIEHQAEVTIEHVSVDDSQSTETVSFDNSKSLENQENLLNNILTRGAHFAPLGHFFWCSTLHPHHLS